MVVHVCKHLLVSLVCLMLMTACIQGEQGLTLEGEIANLDRFYSTDAYLQLVPLNPERTNLEIKEATVVTGPDENTLGGEYVSELPQLAVAPDGRFTYNVSALPPGRYILTLQHLVPLQRPLGHWGPGPWLGRPLGTDEQTVTVLEIAAQNRGNSLVALGTVVIAYSSSDTFLIPQFTQGVVVRP